MMIMAVVDVVMFKNEMLIRDYEKGQKAPGGTRRATRGRGQEAPPGEGGGSVPTTTLISVSS